MRKIQKEKATKLAADLDEQVNANKQRREEQARLNRNQDRIYMAQARTALDLKDFRHTSGNMGFLSSRTREEQDKLHSATMLNKDIWKRTSKLNEVKSQLRQHN